MKVNKPTTEDLANASLGKPLVEWAKGYLAALPLLLTKNPGFYRAFGPYWWLVKRALIDSGNLEFGEMTDAEWIEALDYGDTGLNLLAAFLYYDEREAMGGLFVQEHSFDGPDRDFEYSISDPDMEERFSAAKMFV